MFTLHQIFALYEVNPITMKSDIFKDPIDARGIINFIGPKEIEDDLKTSGIYNRHAQNVPLKYQVT